MRRPELQSARLPARRGFLKHMLAAGVASALHAQQAAGLKIYVHWDFDGAAGIFTRELSWWWEPNVRPEVAAQARELMTADANSASRAALEAGVTELIVCDTHHGGGNLLPNKVFKDPRLSYQFRSVAMENGRRRWMPGLDQSFAGIMLPGHHAKPGTAGSFLPHNNTREWADFTINGQSVGEIGVEACYAGHWDVPLIFVQGDEAACAEAQEQFPGVVTAAVKWARSPELCTGLELEEAYRLTAEKVAEAVAKARRRELQPYKPRLPMTVAIRMSTMDAAAKAATRPDVRRLDDHTVEARVGRQCDILKWITGTGLDMDPPA